VKYTEKKKDLLIAFIINIGFFLFYTCCCTLLHETNDDFAMSFLVEGAYGQRSPYLIFQNVLWGKVLVFLYTLLPMMKWYSITMYAMLFLSFWGITYVLLRKQGRKVGCVSTALMLLFCGFQIYVRFQFSKVAAIATAAGMIMLLYALKYAAEKLEKTICILIGAVLALWGSMIRFQMFAMSVALVGGCIGLYEVWKLFREKKEGWLKQIGTYIAVFGTVGVLSLALYVVDQSFYASEEWQEYMKFNQLRSELWDYELPSYYENLDLYTSLGISEIDYSFYNEWNMDPSVLDVEKMQALIDARPERETSLEEYFSVYPAAFVTNSLYVMFILLALFAICMDKRNLYFALYGFCVVMTLQFYFYLIGRYGLTRIDYSMWAAAVIALLYGMRVERVKEVSTKWIAVALSLGLVFSVAEYNRRKDGYINYVGAFKDFFVQATEDKENLYVMLIMSPTTYYGFGFWEECELGGLSNIYNAYGWESTMPLKESMLEKYDIENVFRDGINNENVYYCVGSYSELFTMYIQDNYDENAILYYEKEISGVPVYSLKTIDQIVSE